jgi:methionyl-tRNA formyltransferase
MFGRLYLNDVAMVAADTTRTQYYIKELIKHKLLPNYILLLLNNDKDLLPGQSEIKTDNELTMLLEKENIQYDIAPNNDINSSEVVEMISNRPESVFIFSGFGGVLLYDNILEVGKKFLHVHGGYLPEYKGSTTNYYSLIDENTIGASSIFLTKEIDCGPVLLRKKFSAPKDRTEIDHIYDSEARSKVLIETLKQHVKSGGWDFELESNKGGETFYIIHPVLKHLAILGENTLR